jgi:uncharacterized membrane protein
MVVATYSALPATDVEHRIELRPNCSLTPRSARAFVGGLAGVTFATAAFFAAQGLWPILPFAGLEIGALWWAVRASLRAGAEREVITISQGTVAIERLNVARTVRVLFARHWATVTLRDPPAARYPSRLVIESHGQACEVGRFLTEDERRGLAGRLRRLVGRASESPALDGTNTGVG